ncbi:MAG TPA: hypothetical protein VF808_08365 [Ktedonobacterales bacterium]
MNPVNDPVELATAITDAILGLLALLCALGLLAAAKRDPWKARMWAVVFGLLAVASALGVAQHGLQTSLNTHNLVIHARDLALAFTIALFVDGAWLDRWGARGARRILPFLAVVALIFFGITFAFPTTFLPFILYEAVAMLFALGLYISLAVARQPGAGLITAGIVVTILAAVAQVSSLAIDVIWRFDHNSIFHFIQMAGALLLYSGLRVSLRAEPAQR